MYRLGAKVPPKKKPDVSAYNNEVPPHPMEARSTKQVHGSKKKKPTSETINLAVKKKTWVQHKYMQVQKNIPAGSRKHTGKSPHFLKRCQVQKKSGQIQKTCTGPKKGCPGPKNMHPKKGKPSKRAASIDGSNLNFSICLHMSRSQAVATPGTAILALSVLICFNFAELCMSGLLIAPDN